MGTVLLTGAAGGIGQATAKRLAQQGQRCVLVDQDATTLHALLATLPAVAHGAHLVRPVDVTDAAQLATLPEGLPALDAVINNAGVMDQSQLALEAQTPENWQRVLDVNLHAPALIFQAARSRLHPGGHIVNVSSGAGLHAIPWRGAYSPSKAGLIAQTRAAAQAHPEFRFHVLCPGFVETPMVQNLMQTGRLSPERAVAKVPLGRLASPEEMACALTFLANAASHDLCADPLCLDGGTSVFGGSQPYTPCAYTALPCDTPLSLTVHGAWDGTVPDPVPGGYSAHLDTTVLASAPGQRLNATLAAARRFSAPASASLTILLPRETVQDWTHAGDLAAARMLIAALACEWGAQARRVNAIVVDAHAAADTLWPILNFVAGAQAQYLTGQTLCLHPQT